MMMICNLNYPTELPIVIEYWTNLNISVHDASLVAWDDGLDNLLEELSSHCLLQDTFLRDVVKQILDGLWSLHDNDEAVVPLKVVEDLDYSFYVGYFT